MRVDGEPVAAIRAGLLVLLGVNHADTPADADRLAERVRRLRIFPDAPPDAPPDPASGTAPDGARGMNAPLGDREVLVVSQFTLYGDTSRGHRPSWGAAAPAALAEPLYERFADALGAARGVFGADMAVSLVNDGPVTLLLESR